MAPYRADRTWLIEELKDAVGHDRAVRAPLRRLPAEGDRPRPTLDVAPRPPPCPQPVVVFSDATVFDKRTPTGDWVAFARCVTKAGSPLTLLTPVSAGSIPAEIRRRVNVVELNGQTTMADAQAATAPPKQRHDGRRTPRTSSTVCARPTPASSSSRKSCRWRPTSIRRCCAAPACGTCRPPAPSSRGGSGSACWSSDRGWTSSCSTVEVADLMQELLREDPAALHSAHELVLETHRGLDPAVDLFEDLGVAVPGPGQGGRRRARAAPPAGR